MYKEKSMFIHESIMYRDSRSLNSSDLAVMITNMKNDPTWDEGELKSAILLKSPAKKVILTVLHKGTEISSYQSSFSLTFQVIGGNLKLNYGKNSFNLKKGEVLMMNEKLKYTIFSVEESAFLMILSTGKEN